jgi:ACR3 family arsenite efflux pump ArsB
MNGHKTIMAAVSVVLIMRPDWSLAQAATEPDKYNWDHRSPVMWGGSWFGMMFGPLTAIVLFGFQSGAALATVVGVLVEVPVMLSVVRIVNQSKDWYERGAAVVREGAST